MRYLIPILLLTACTTPQTVLTNHSTGQVVTCGGTATGSLVGGLIGYEIQKSNERDCVKMFQANGFK